MRGIKVKLKTLHKQLNNFLIENTCLVRVFVCVCVRTCVYVCGWVEGEGEWHTQIQYCSKYLTCPRKANH